MNYRSSSTKGRQIEATVAVQLGLVIVKGRYCVCSGPARFGVRPLEIASGEGTC